MIDHKESLRKHDTSGPGLGDDVPCVKCGGPLDTGLECTECGHDNYTAVMGEPFPEKTAMTDLREKIAQTLSKLHDDFHRLRRNRITWEDQADTILTLFADTIKDAERWRMIPAFLEDHQINYIRLLSQVDAAIDAAKETE